jgi:peptidoglycan/LPS O-acetylase OafA/YrhL
VTATPTLSAVRGDDTRIPSLDGLRAISIALVLVSHLEPTGLVPGLWRLNYLLPGNLGVRVFFVISGFLITSLLVTEHARYGRIKVGRFYRRRALRIMPAYYVFLGAIALASAVGLTAVPRASLLSAATYTSNYREAAFPLGHSWSLSVEEQFYLLWPGALALLGLRLGFSAAWLVLLIAPTCRAAAHWLGPLWPDNPTYSFECVADALATGCLLARYRDRLWTWTAYRRVMGPAGAVHWPLVVVALALAKGWWPAYAAVVGITVLNLAIAGGIDWCLRNATSAVGRFLNVRPVVFVGTLSYSLYLWHLPFMRIHDALPLPVMFGLIAIATLGSHYLVERPGLALRKWIEAPRAPAPGVHGVRPVPSNRIPTRPTIHARGAGRPEEAENRAVDL